MRLWKLQRYLIALVIVCFLVCMTLAIAVIADFDVMSFFFGHSKPSRNSNKQDSIEFESQQDYIDDKLVDSQLLNVKDNKTVAVQTSNNPLPVDSLLRELIRNRPTKEMNNLKSPDEDKPMPDKMLPDYDVHVFYYPWYGNPSVDGNYLHWNHALLPHWNADVAARYPSGRHVPPNDIGANFYPRLGPYSSQDRDVINDHMRQIKSSGAGVLAVSWYPPGLADNEGHNVDDIMPTLLDAAANYNLKVCFHIEPFAERSHNTLRTNLSYIVNRYGNHSAFYRWGQSGLPLYYVYDSYMVRSDDWKALLLPQGANTVRGTDIDGVFVGLVVEQKHAQELVGSGFDGMYTYFASDGFSYGSSTKNWVELAEFARKSKVLFIPSVGPGYVDTRVRPWNGQNTKERNHGKYYENHFRAAVDILAPIISITSFNEWHEGTQIEEAVPKDIDSFKYLDYLPNGPDFYLELTRRWILIYMDRKQANARRSFLT